MGLNSQLVDNKTKTQKEYPILTINKWANIVVLFSRPSEGVVVYSDNSYYQLGDYRTDWIPSSFQTYSGIVELSN